ILQGDGLIEPESGVQRLNRLARGLIAKNELRRIARQNAHNDEDEGEHRKERRHAECGAADEECDYLGIRAPRHFRALGDSTEPPRALFSLISRAFSRKTGSHFFAARSRPRSVHEMRLLRHRRREIERALQIIAEIEVILPSPKLELLI